ncbi:hypothetical protein ABZ725_43165 [Streptomyces sp. NPDC006872]|uniref:hypothetical protein n=1 Tax=Streptomyces sp. NPDC006872 TaxID=3155720 RepID=UPI0033BFD3DD
MGIPGTYTMEEVAADALAVAAAGADTDAIVLTVQLAFVGIVLLTALYALRETSGQGRAPDPAVGEPHP